MKVTEEGLALIRESEGFRATAYRDAVGVWTIGFGHTSAAGPPQVVTGLAVTRAEAEKILARDVQNCAAALQPLIRAPLSDAQFSALVSFAYNVGVGAFARSSVLKAVNGEDFATVPRRLGQWVKAGGRTLPGLVKRRAAEAALFLSRAETTGAEEAPAGPVAPQVAKPMLRSRTLWSAAVVAAATLLKTLQPPAALAWGLTICVIGAAAVIVVERLRKMKWEGL